MDEVKAKAGEPEVVIEYEPEADDYNYEAPETEVDEEELKQLTYTGQGTDTKKVGMIIGIIAAAAIVGWIIGLIAGNVAASNNDAARKSSIAATIQKSYDEKIQNFTKFADEFDKRIANADYETSAFDAVVGGYQKYDFMLDMSSEVSSEVILLNGDSGANPVKNLREYSANTMLLTQLLSIHRNETRIDADEIQILMEQSGAAKVTYAMQISPDGVFYLGSTAPREQFANGVINIFTLRGPITSDQELSESYSAFKSEKGWNPAQRALRDYVPGKNEKDLADLDLPNRILYEATDRRGNDVSLFADEIVIVDRQLLFGNAANALDRYKQRTAQIKKLLDETRSVGATISNDLKYFVKN